MTKNKPFRVTKWIGILMILISLAGFYGLKDAERVSRSAWQVAYMFLVEELARNLRVYHIWMP